MASRFSTCIGVFLICMLLLIEELIVQADQGVCDYLAKKKDRRVRGEHLGIMRAKRPKSQNNALYQEMRIVRVAEQAQSRRRRGPQKGADFPVEGSVGSRYLGVQCQDKRERRLTGTLNRRQVGYCAQIPKQGKATSRQMCGVCVIVCDNRAATSNFTFIEPLSQLQQSAPGAAPAPAVASAKKPPSRTCRHEAVRRHNGRTCRIPGGPSGSASALRQVLTSASGQEQGLTKYHHRQVIGAESSRRAITMSPTNTNALLFKHVRPIFWGGGGGYFYVCVQ